MNLTFQEILKQTNTVVPFLQWYKENYQDLAIFQNLQFEHQIGVFMRYFEEKLNMAISADHSGYIVYYARPQLASNAIIAEVKKGGNWWIRKEVFTKEKTVVESYKVGILHIFKHLDLPF